MLLLLVFGHGRNGQQRVRFGDATKAKLKWHGILRRQAWDTLVTVRSRELQTHMQGTVRARMIGVLRAGTGLRPNDDDTLWRPTELANMIFQAWRRWTPWRQ